MLNMMIPRITEETFPWTQPNAMGRKKATIALAMTKGEAYEERAWHTARIILNMYKI
jgi:hypothetical protein